MSKLEALRQAAQDVTKVFKVGRNWTSSFQAVASSTQFRDGSQAAGPAYERIAPAQPCDLRAGPCSQPVAGGRVSFEISPHDIGLRVEIDAGVPITDAKGILVGILTNRDLRFCSEFDRPITDPRRRVVRLIQVGSERPAGIPVNLWCALAVLAYLVHQVDPVNLSSIT